MSPPKGSSTDLHEENLFLKKEIDKLQEQIQNLSSSQKPPLQKNIPFSSSSLPENIHDMKGILQAILDTTEDFIILKDCDFKIIYANLQFCEALGKDLNEILGKTETEIGIPPELVYGIPEKGKYGFRDDDKLVIHGMTVYRPKEKLIFHDNSEHLLNTYKKPISDNKGNIIGVLILGRDITEQRQTEKALQKTENHYKTLFNSANDAIYITDFDGKFLDINSQGFERLGFSKPELLNLNLSKIERPISPTQELTPIQSSLFKEGKYRYESYNIKKNGEFIPVEMNSQIIDYFGTKAVLSISRDITERLHSQREMEEHRQQLIESDKLASLGTLVAGVAHEINNPNTFIMLNVPVCIVMVKEILCMLKNNSTDFEHFKIGGMTINDVTARLPKLLEDIENGAKRIQGIVNSLKDYARSDGSKNEEEVDLSKVIQDSIQLTSNRIKKATDHFNVDVPTTLPPVKGIPQRLEQVIINLIINAFESLTDRSQSVDIKAYYAPEENNVVVSISDQGCGIPESNLNHVTDPFFTTKRNTGGTGLGLAISSGIIKDHGGTLKIKSSHNKGTQVTLILPESIKHE